MEGVWLVMIGNIQLGEAEVGEIQDSPLPSDEPHNAMSNGKEVRCCTVC